MVMSGGAVATACEAIAERAVLIGASLLQSEVDNVRIEGGMVVAPGGTYQYVFLLHRYPFRGLTFSGRV